MDNFNDQKRKFFFEDIPENIQSALNEHSSIIDKTLSLCFGVLHHHLEIGSKSELDIVPSLHMRNILEFGSSISSLIKASSPDPANLMVRAMLESSLYLGFLVKENFEKRAKAYLFCKKIEERNKLDRFDDRTTVGSQVIGELSNCNDQIDFRDLFTKHAEIDNNRTSINAFLNLPEYSNTRLTFEERKTELKRKNKKIQWYNFEFDFFSIRDISCYLERLSEYEFIYRSTSNYVHSSNLIKDIVMGEKPNTAGFTQIRMPFQSMQITSTTYNLLITTFFNFLSNFYPEEQADFLRSQILIGNEMEKLTSINRGKSI